MRRSIIQTIGALIFVLVAAFSFAGTHRAQTSQGATAPVVDHSVLVTLMRIINTAEVSYRSDYGHFNSWDELYDTGYISRSLHSNLAISRGPNVLPNVQVEIVVSPAEDSYAAAVHDKAGADHLYSVFSDPKGLIYQGQPLATKSTNASHVTLINLVRALNTAEVSYSSKYHHFADFDELNGTGYLDAYQKGANVTFAKAPEVLGNLEVNLVVPPKYDTWAIAVHDQANDHGLYSVFSDSTGIIYEAQPLQ